MRPITYVSDTFPTLSQTFTRAEARGLVREGFEVRVASLHRPGPRDPVHDPAADPPVEYLPPPLSGAVLAACVRAARRRPGVLAGLAAWCLRPHSQPFRPSFQVRAPLHLAWACWLSERIPAGTHVHVQFTGSASNVAWMAARLAGATFSFTAHSEWSFVLLPPKVRDAVLVTCISEFERRRLLLAAPEADASKVVVSRLGVDLAAWPALPPPAGRPGLRVLAVGMLGATKGHDVLLRALALLRDRAIAADADIVGEGPERPRLEAAIAALRLHDVARLRGGLPHDEVRRLTQACDVAVLACRATKDGDFDGIPVALMEAMATGRPVVSTRLSAIPELVEDGVSGLLVAPEDPEALAAALARLAGDPALRARMGAAARLRVEADYDAEDAQARLARLLRHHLPAGALATA